MGTTALPDRAQVVIIGGGVVGTSVAYHLTRAGWTAAASARRTRGRSADLPVGAT